MDYDLQLDILLQNVEHAELKDKDKDTMEIIDLGGLLCAVGGAIVVVSYLNF